MEPRKRISTFVAPEIHKTIKARAQDSDETSIEWVRDAVLAKLNHPTEKDKVALTGLSDEDRISVKEYIEFLRISPRDFKDALQKNIATLRQLERRVCHRK